MGWCTHFRRTWRPGYGSDVIDPNKAFDFERRLILIKKMLIIVLLLALLAGLIYVLVTYIPSNHDASNANKTQSTVSSLTSMKEENLTIGSVISSLTPTIVDKIANNSAASLPASEESTTKKTILASSVFSTINHDNSSSMAPSLKNSTNTSPHYQQNDNRSNLSCSSNIMECIALSKQFKTVITFTNSSRHNESVEGYVMVRMQNDTWHPYCHPHWTLEMGYRLCMGLGFQQLIKLNTIDIYQLRQRITRLGKDVSLHAESPSQSQELLVLTTESSIIGPLKTNTSQYYCEAGYISCN